MNSSVLKALAAGIALGATPLLAVADDGLYLGANYAMFEYTNDDVDSGEEVNPDAVILRVGLEASDWLGIEARGGLGLDDDSTTIAGVGEVTAELDELYGGYARAGLPMGDAVMPYIIGGWTHVEGEGELTSAGIRLVEEDTWEDWSWGAGVDFNLSDTVALNVEWMRYIDDGPEELDALAVGLRTAF